MSANSVPRDGLLSPGLQTAASSLCPPTAEREAASFLVSLQSHDEGPTFMPTNKHHSPKDPISKYLQVSSHWALERQHMNWGRGKGPQIFSTEHSSCDVSATQILLRG